MRTAGYIVFQENRPCTLKQVTDGPEGLVLLPGDPVARFGMPRDARKAITRTMDLAKHLRGSMVDQWSAIAPLFSGHPYVIVRLVSFPRVIRPAVHTNPDRQQYYL